MGANEIHHLVLLNGHALSVAEKLDLDELLDWSRSHYHEGVANHWDECTKIILQFISDVTRFLTSPRRSVLADQAASLGLILNALLTHPLLGDAHIAPLSENPLGRSAVNKFLGTEIFDSFDDMFWNDIVRGTFEIELDHIQSTENSDGDPADFEFDNFRREAACFRKLLKTAVRLYSADNIGAQGAGIVDETYPHIVMIKALHALSKRNGLPTKTIRINFDVLEPATPFMLFVLQIVSCVSVALKQALASGETNMLDRVPMSAFASPEHQPRKWFPMFVPQTDDAVSRLIKKALSSK